MEQILLLKSIKTINLQMFCLLITNSTLHCVLHKHHKPHLVCPEPSLQAALFPALRGCHLPHAWSPHAPCSAWFPWDRAGGSLPLH